MVRAFDVNNLMETAQRQRELIRQFRDSATSWRDETFRAQIIETARSHGDLRYRSILIPEMPFTELRCFYTRAFHGVYVFRDMTRRGQLLVLEDTQYTDLGADDAAIWHIDDESLSQVLLDEDIVDVPMGWYKRNIEVLEQLRSYLIADLYYRVENPPGNLLEINDAQVKLWLSKHSTDLPDELGELERLILKLRSGDSVKGIKVSLGLQKLLMRPSKEASQKELYQNVVWQLIARLIPIDIERLYLHNRVHFYDLYRTWPEAKQKWSIQLLASKGYPRKPSDKK
jgi:hypothetical protein